MSTFDYLSVFISIVVGLAVVRVLEGVVTILDRRSQGVDWLHAAWIGFFVLYLPYFWWFTFDWRRVDEWRLPIFLFVVFFSMLAYLTTAVLVPTREADVEDLSGYFMKVHSRFFILMALTSATDVADSFLKPGNMADVGASYLPVMAVTIGGNLVAARSTSRRFHRAWVTISYLILVIFGFGAFADVFSVG